MTTWAIRTPYDRDMAIKAVQSRDMPCTVIINKGAPRSIEQNKLQRLWLNEAEEQGDCTAEWYRGWCKLQLGVAILINNSEQFAEQWQRLFSHLTWVEKHEMMMVPIDFPITRAMSTKQKKEYLDRMYEHFTGLGFRLTEP